MHTADRGADRYDDGRHWRELAREIYVTAAILGVTTYLAPHAVEIPNAVAFGVV